ncbi:helix-turn-helix transcriptional regulator [Actinoplanes sp. NPDC023714]|uniref:helix-turn-helix transcriptional regulator n=1 Tax=Actinoplanes sp. NPDC023714 TaxID=3154322 RepID=UPI0033EEB9F8
MVDRKATELIDVLRSKPYLDLTDLAQAALLHLVGAMGARAQGAVLHSVHPSTMLEVAVAEPSDFHRAMQRDFAIYQRHNMQQPLLRYCLTHPDETPVTLSQCAPDRRRWEETALYREYFRPLGVKDQLAIVTNFGGLHHSGVSVSGPERGCFSDRDQALMRVVRDEFRVAVERAEHQMYLRLSQDFEAQLQTSEQVAVIAVDRLGLVRMCSGALWGIVDECLGPFARGAPLPAALADVARHLAGVPPSSRRPYVVPSFAGDASFVVLWFGRHGDREGVLRIDLAHAYDDRWCRLQPDEVRLMSLWASGRSADSIGSELRISAKTVHNKINKIYTKLDVPNQRAAIREFYGRRLREASA